MNLWHDVSTGPDAPELIHVVVEIPHNTRNKYEMDPEHGYFRVDRVLYASLHYPADYGLIPRTLYEDGDALDAMVLIKDPTFAGCVVVARPIGMFRMKDNGVADDKILAVLDNDPLYAHLRRLEDVPDHQLAEIAHFFEHYKDLEKKEVEPGGWAPRDVACARIRHAQAAYQRRFNG
ncbi:MAG: inorganic diphosphatase [Anaerolineales bacterium]|nr:inorganic diphosphatase [Anaerolineales bacterium]